MNNPQYPILLLPKDFLKYYYGNPYPNTFAKIKPVQPSSESYSKPASYGCAGTLLPFALLGIVIFPIAFF